MKISFAPVDPRFVTYLNYLRHLSMLMTEESPEAFLRPVAMSRMFRRIEGGKCRDPEQVGGLLRNAWSTELQIEMVGQNSDLLPHANHWTPIQLYYLVYLACCSYFLASGRPVTESHSAALKTMTRELEERPELFPVVMQTLCRGNPGTSTHCVEPLPDGVVLQGSIRKSATSIHGRPTLLS
jgi:hypothetical protein